MKKQKTKNNKTLTELIDQKYGKRGTKKREKWEKGYKNFKQSVQL